MTASLISNEKIYLAKITNVSDTVMSALNSKEFQDKKYKLPGGWVCNSIHCGLIKTCDTISRLVILNECNFHLQSI